jgi:hypothetical protein
VLLPDGGRLRVPGRIARVMQVGIGEESTSVVVRVEPGHRSDFVLLEEMARSHLGRRL